MRLGLQLLQVRLVDVSCARQTVPCVECRSRAGLETSQALPLELSPILTSDEFPVEHRGLEAVNVGIDLLAHGEEIVHVLADEAVRP